jgi:ATP-dependent helicase HrpB
VAYRLWSKLEHASRQAHRTPSITNADLADLALELAAWGGGNDVRFITAPPEGALAQARQLRFDLHAIAADGAITDLGRQLVALPFHPRLARMIAIDRSPLACIIAALVDERDVFRGRPDELPADLELRVAVIANRQSFDGADRRAVQQVRDRTADAARRGGIRFDLDAVEVGRTGSVLQLAYPDRVAAQRRPGQFQLRTGGGAWLPDTDPLAAAPLIVAADLDGRRDRARIRLGAAVDLAQLLDHFGNEIIEQRELRWDSDRDDLVEVVDRRLGAMRLGQQRRPPSSGEDTTAALMERVRSTGLEALHWSDRARHLRDRVGFLHRTAGAPWPDWSTHALTSSLDEWLAPYLPGATGRRDLERLDLVMVLRSQLPWPEGGDLDDIAPPELLLPAGRNVPIAYHGDAPTASVRVQDLFGLTVHPTAAGRALRLELLSPADRPIQITADLPGFWAGSWSEVRKEMAGRYPKHAWPLDPTTAPPKRMKDR